MDAVVEYVVDYLKWFASNFQNNALHMFDGWNWKRWIRLVAILGAYLLFRPYMEKWASKLQGKEHEKDVDFYEEATKKGKLSPNTLRGGLAAEEESEEDAETSATDWGKKARKRQRQMERKKLEAEEKKRLDAEGDAEDKDIREYLVDYVEGEDGW
jgi:hypothetical protein